MYICGTHRYMYIDTSKAISIPDIPSYTICRYVPIPIGILYRMPRLAHRYINDGVIN